MEKLSNSRSLPKQWRPKVTVIQETNDLSILAIEELLGSLKVHELELRKEGGDSRGKSIALKVQKGSSTKALKSSLNIYISGNMTKDIWILITRKWPITDGQNWPYQRLKLPTAY